MLLRHRCSGSRNYAMFRCLLQRSLTSFDGAKKSHHRAVCLSSSRGRKKLFTSLEFHLLDCRLANELVIWLLKDSFGIGEGRRASKLWNQRERQASVWKLCFNQSFECNLNFCEVWRLKLWIFDGNINCKVVTYFLGRVSLNFDWKRLKKYKSYEIVYSSFRGLCFHGKLFKSLKVWLDGARTMNIDAWNNFFKTFSYSCSFSAFCESFIKSLYCFWKN